MVYSVHENRNDIYDLQYHTEIGNDIDNVKIYENLYNFYIRMICSLWKNEEILFVTTLY